MAVGLQDTPPKALSAGSLSAFTYNVAAAAALSPAIVAADPVSANTLSGAAGPVLPAVVGAIPASLGTSVGTLAFSPTGFGEATPANMAGKFAAYADLIYQPTNLTSLQSGFFYAAVTLSAGIQYAFDLYTYNYRYRAGSTALTPYLDLYDSNGALQSTSPLTIDNSYGTPDYGGISFTASASGTYYVQVAFTGTSTDLYQYFDLRAAESSIGPSPTPPTGPGPVITPVHTSISATIGQFFTTTELFSASPDTGGTISQYEFYVNDSAGGSGHLFANGSSQANDAVFYVSTTNFNLIDYAAGYGSETLSVRANDGTGTAPHWGAWASITITAPTDPSPSVTAPSVTLAAGLTPVAFSSLFTINDPNGVSNANINYTISYSGTGGTLELAGVVQAENTNLAMNGTSSGTNIFAGLSSLTFVPNAAGGSDTITLTVSDGDSVPVTKTFTVTDGGSYSRPTITASARSINATSGPVAASSLFSVVDHNDVAASALTYTLLYSGSGGVMELGGVAEAEATTLSLTESQIANLSYLPGVYGGTDTVTLTVSDGYETSTPVTFTITSPNPPGPVVTPAGSTLTATRDQQFTFSELVAGTTDAYPDYAISGYQFDVIDSLGGVGSFLVNGAAQKNDTVITVSDTSTISFQSVSGTEVIWVRANDGTATNPHWGAWVSATINGAAKTPGPVFTPVNATINATRDEDFAPLTLYTENDAYANANPGVAISQYQFDDIDSAGGIGNFIFNYVTVEKNDAVFTVNAGDISKVDYFSVSGTQVIWARANDGTAADPNWGAWSAVTVQGAPTTPAAVFTPKQPVYTAARDALVAPLSLFTESDAYTASSVFVGQYEFLNSDALGGVGSFVFAGNAEQNDKVFAVDLISLNQLSYQPVSGTEVLWVRGNDGTDTDPNWGAWSSVTVTAPPRSSAPIFSAVNAKLQTAAGGETLSAPAALFYESDPLGLPLSQYQFDDIASPGSVGSFQFNGIPDANNTVLTIAATALSFLSYKITSGTQVIWIRGNDGTAADPNWGSWVSVTLTVPTAASSTASVPAAGAIIPIPNLSASVIALPTSAAAHSVASPAALLSTASPSSSTLFAVSHF